VAPTMIDYKLLVSCYSKLKRSCAPCKWFHHSWKWQDLPRVKKAQKPWGITQLVISHSRPRASTGISATCTPTRLTLASKGALCCTLDRPRYSGVLVRPTISQYCGHHAWQEQTKQTAKKRDRSSATHQLVQPNTNLTIMHSSLQQAQSYSSQGMQSKHSQEHAGVPQLDH
jgi:hypothetical protein